jgi:hypothetical protein
MRLLQDHRLRPGPRATVTHVAAGLAIAAPTTGRIRAGVPPDAAPRANCEIVKISRPRRMIQVPTAAGARAKRFRLVPAGSSFISALLPIGDHHPPQATRYNAWTEGDRHPFLEDVDARVVPTSTSGTARMHSDHRSRRGTMGRTVPLRNCRSRSRSGRARKGIGPRKVVSLGRSALCGATVVSTGRSECSFPQGMCLERWG